MEFVRQYAAQIERPPKDTICLFDADNFRRPTLAHVPGGAGQQIKERLAADFTGWETDNAKFEEQLERVVKALQTGDAREAAPVKRL